MSKTTFHFVYVPADESQAMEERTLTVCGEEEAVSAMTTYCKAHFTKVKDMSSLSEEERKSHGTKMVESLKQQNLNANVTEEQLSFLSMMNLVDTVPLIVNKRATGWVGVNLYVDDQGEAKQLPHNKRASAICAAAGRVVNVRGDAFVGRFFDNDARFERRDFRLDEVQSFDTEFFVTARTNAMAQNQSQSASLSAALSSVAASSSAAVGTSLRRCGQGFLDCANEGSMRCARCKDIVYCSAACQRQDWSRHKKVCAKQ